MRMGGRIRKRKMIDTSVDGDALDDNWATTSGEVHQRIDAQTAGHLTVWVDRTGVGGDGVDG
jgi:hypothetical protein